MNCKYKTYELIHLFFMFKNATEEDMSLLHFQHIQSHVFKLLFLVTVCSFGYDTLCDENRSDCPLVYNEEWGKILILIPHMKNHNKNDF